MYLLHERGACRQVGWSVRRGRQAAVANDDICSACTPVANRLLQMGSEQARSRSNLWASSQRWLRLDDEERVPEQRHGTLLDFRKQPPYCDLQPTYNHTWPSGDLYITWVTLTLTLTHISLGSRAVISTLTYNHTWPSGDLYITRVTCCDLQLTYNHTWPSGNLYITQVTCCDLQPTYNHTWPSGDLYITRVTCCDLQLTYNHTWPSGDLYVTRVMCYDLYTDLQ